ncbi:MAG: branched-chain amino acid transporter AzlD [Ruminococcaceae bacterium]|nr:branched-chain amino acid transporter AzlD [Oscillospiraceae bacterium]
MTYGVHMTTSGHPFWFPDRPTPRYVLFLGKALPPAVFGMLVVYCLKSVNLLAAPNGLPEAIALVVVIALHLWQRKMMLSIAGGTLCYMLLVQFVF